MITVYEVCGVLFTRPELCVSALKLSYSNVAIVTPNALLTQCNVHYTSSPVLMDIKPDETIHIHARHLHDKPEHI